jgi:hypothetical protein
MKRIAIPALIVMVAVAGFVAVAGWNGAEEPRQVITVTEHELALPFRPATADNDPTLSLLLQYEGRYDPLESRNWLPEARLRELGFALHIPAGSPQAVSTYDRVPPRVAWVVFEYDGPVGRDIQRRRELRMEYAHVPSGRRSRLVPVDAGLDYQQLRARYPAGHLIVRGVIGLNYLAADAGGPLVYGMLREVVPTRVAVPYPFRSLLRPLTDGIPEPSAKPRYEADLAIGSLGLPYLQALRVY